MNKDTSKDTDNKQNQLKLGCKISLTFYTRVPMSRLGQYKIAFGNSKLDLVQISYMHIPYGSSVMANFHQFETGFASVNETRHLAIKSYILQHHCAFKLCRSKMSDAAVSQF